MIENIDKLSSSEIRSKYIDFEYNNRKRSMHVFSDCMDYQSETHSVEKTTCCSIVSNEDLSEGMLKPLVEYFGGFYTPDDCDGEWLFFPFNDELLKKYPLEKAILDKLSNEKDWEFKIKMMEFVKNNLDFISELNKNYKRL